MSLFDRLRPYLGKLIGTLVGSACAWILVHYHIVVDTEAQAKIVETIIEIIAMLLIIREGTATTVNKKLNPAGAASAHLAKEGKQEAEAMKAAESTP